MEIALTRAVKPKPMAFQAADSIDGRGSEVTRGICLSSPIVGLQTPHCRNRAAAWVPQRFLSGQRAVWRRLRSNRSIRGRSTPQMATDSAGESSRVQANSSTATAKLNTPAGWCACA